MDNINRPITIKEIGSITSNLLKQKAQTHVGSLVNSTKHLINKMIPILYNLQKIEVEGTHLNSL